MAEKIFLQKPTLRFREFKPSEEISRWSQSAISDRLFLLFVVLWLGPLILSVIYTLINFSQLPNQIPLFYSRVWGKDQLAEKIYIFLPAFGVLFLGVFNLALAVSFHSRDKVFSYLLAGASSLVAFLCAITTLNIINLLR